VRTTRTSGVPGPDGHEHDSFVRVDDFARALDGGRHSTSDATLNRELTLVATLRRAGMTMVPDPGERDRMRQRVMAEFSSVVHDGTSPVLPLRESRRHRRIPQQTRGRFVVAAAAALCLLMSLSGMSLLLSREALPGDTLYAVKRSAESAALGLTFGDENKALKHLEFAKARVSEIEAMADQGAEASWPAGDDRFVQALDDFERDTAAGTRLLTEVAASGSGDGRSAILPSLRGWVEQQESRLRAVRGALPLTANARLDGTLELLDRVITRVDALNRRSDCATITLDTHDDLGLLPARGTCESAPPNGASAAAPLPADAANVVEADSADSLVPPGLLSPPPDASIAEPDQPGRLSRLPGEAENVLPSRDDWEQGPSEPALGEPSAPPALLPVPLPAGIPPLLQLLPLENPHVE